MKYYGGFSLIELLVALAIVAILASLAVPAYNDSVNRSKRADAKAYLMQISSDQEAFYATNFSYANSITAAGQLNYNDVNSPEGHFTAALVVQPAGCAAGVVSCRTYTIQLTPTFTDNKCTTISLAGDGTRSSTGTGTIEECWR